MDPEHPTAEASLKALEGAPSAEEEDLIPIRELLELGVPRISLCLIAKNESRYLDGCLESVKGIVNEIVLVDTGSSDDTVAIAERHGARIFHSPWKNDFAAARNESISHATGDWILVLDADERITEDTRELLREVCYNVKPIGYGLVIDNLLGNDADNPTEIQTAVVMRLFRNLPDMCYEGAIHEQIIPAAKRSGMPQFECTVRIRHLGYLNKPFVERDKTQRNLEILLKQVQDEPDNSYVYFNLGQTYKIYGDFNNAETNYLKALELLKAQRVAADAPYYLNLYYNLATLYYKAGKSAEALKVCEESLPIYPDYPDLHYVKGLALSDLGNYAEALQCFQHALTLGGKVFAAGSDIGTSSYRAYHAIGITYSRMGRMQEAKQYFQQALETWAVPTADFHADFGLLNIREGEFQQAIGHFADALESEPNHAQALLGSSVAYRGLEFYQDAIVLAKRAAECQYPFSDLYLI
jgi:glycosyltransferase involved in cell wall biosynthesis